MAWPNRGCNNENPNDAEEDPDDLDLARAFEEGVRSQRDRDPFHAPIKASGSHNDFMSVIGMIGSYDDNDGWSKELARIRQLEKDWEEELERRKSQQP